MVRRLFVGACCCLLAGCLLSHSHHMPPRNETDAREWFESTIDTLDVNVLRCWQHASEFHRTRGSSATYVWTYCPGHNMVGPVYDSYHLFTPIPVQFLPRIEARLANNSPQERSRYLEESWELERYKGCSWKEARDAWK